MVALLLIVFTIFFSAVSPLFAQQEISYDPYAPILRYPEKVQPEAAEKRETGQFFARILEQPFRPLGYGIGKTAEWVERKHMDDKVVWFFDELAAHGIHPRPKFPTAGSFGTIGIEARIELEKLLKLDQPYFSAAAFGGWTPNKDFDGSTVELGGDYRIEMPDSSVFHKGLARYSRSSAESFYGIGQDTSRGEYSTYKPEELKLLGSLGYRFGQTLEGTGSVVYQKMHIGNGNRERVGKIKEVFPAGSIPGVNGGDLIGLIASLVHDNRDHKTDPRRGGKQAVDFSYHHDTDGSDFHYLKVAGSASHFFPVFSDRRIFALRLTAEKNQELGGGEIPFFNMSRLGGSDITDGSELLRSYKYNRFFDEGLLLMNAEYRYNIYEYGNFAADTFAFFDLGEVFGEFGDFGIDELKFSWGAGFNMKFRRKTLCSVFIARGSEGWESGMRTKASF